MRQIDRQSSMPYYAQVKDILKDAIRSGKWNAADQLPSEAELCEMFDVSRTVIRQALQDLMHDGLITRQRGKGSFVATPKINAGLVQKLTGFYQDMVDQGYTPVTQVLKQALVPASPDVAAHLRIPEGSDVIEIVRLRFVQNIPVVLVTSYLPYALCPGLLSENLSNQSLYALLEEKYGLMIARGRRTIEAVGARSFEARLLSVPENEPLFLLISDSFLGDGTPIEYYQALHRGDRSRFEVELVRVREIGDSMELRDLPRANLLT